MAKKVADSEASRAQRHEVAIKLTGGMRRGSIAIEAASIPLRKTGDGTFEGKKTLPLEAPVITATSVVKGALLAKYDFAITINDVTKHIKGHIRDGVKTDEENFPFSAFKLDE